MFAQAMKRTPASQRPALLRIIILFDLENCTISLGNTYGPGEIQLGARLARLRSWLERNFGHVLGGFVFSPAHIGEHYLTVCRRNNLFVIFCPKECLEIPEYEIKKGKMITVRDTVDSTLMEFGKMMFDHSDANCLCLVSGDDDFVPLLEAAKERNIKRIIVPPTLGSLSKRAKGLVRLADQENGRKLVFPLDRM